MKKVRKNDLKAQHYKLGYMLDEKKKIELLKKYFKKRIGYELNIENPQSYNEKIMWLKLYNQDPRITRCCDKFTVKGYVEEKLGPGYTVPTIAQWDDPDDIDFDALPDQFVLKVNWASGYNIIVKDKSKLDREEARSQLKRWMQPDRNSYYQYFNWGYKNVKPVCYAEEYLEQIDGQLYDYKFLFSNGKLVYLLIVTDRLSDNVITKTYFDENFEIMPIQSGHRANSTPELPKNLERMLEISKILADDFPLCRVDFYELGDDIKIGEMTFYCGGGVLPMTPVEWDYKVGAKIQLPAQKRIIDKDPVSIIVKRNLRKAKDSIKKILKKIRRVVIHKEFYKQNKYLVFLGIRLPYETHVEVQENIQKKYIRIIGVEICYKKEPVKQKKEINSDTPYKYVQNPPMFAFAAEDHITKQIQQIHCEQRGYKQLGYFPNLKNPVTLNEKIIWLALNYKNPEIKIAADKATAKKWVSDRIGAQHVVPLLGVYDDVNDIDFSALPKQFVIKLNAGWGADKVMVVRDKSKLNLDRTKAILSSWLYPWNSYYYKNMGVTDEKKDKVRIIIEEFLDAGNGATPDDYKFYCCNGEPQFALVVGDRGTDHQTRSFVDMNWEILPVSRILPGQSKPLPIAEYVEEPECLEEMKDLARKLSKGFPFVRVDFYQVNGKVYLGEMTFTPGMFLAFSSKEWDRKLGEYLQLPEIEEK